MASSKDFLEFHGLPKEIIFSLIDRAQSLATACDDRTMPQSLSGKRAALVADDSGWRNTTAFDLGKAPVVNARTRSNHPCETLGDLAYIQSKKGTLEGMKVVGVALDANILRSWVEASISMPIQVRQVYPENWHVKDVSLLGPNFAASTDLAELLDADVIVTDSWPSDANEEQLLEYQISTSILEKCRPDAIFLPCPPVSREKEVTANAMRHPTYQSVAAKAHLLHAQNALLE
jgi:ornithine carbamoyltransferase